MIANSLTFIGRLSEVAQEIVGWNYLTGHLWVMLLTGIIFCFMGVMGDEKNNANEKLARTVYEIIKPLVDDKDEYHE